MTALACSVGSGTVGDEVADAEIEENIFTGIPLKSGISNIIETIKVT